jgi:hypothetical protein
MYSILFFAHKNTYNKTNTHPLSPQTPWLLLPIIQKQGQEKGWLFMQRRLGTVRRWHKKVGFVSCFGRFWVAEEQTMMATNDRMASVDG